MGSLRISVFVVVALFLGAFAAPALAAPPTSEIIADAATGRILHGQNINSLRHPASLTKVMTLYLTFTALEQGKLRLTDYLPVSWNAASQPPSRLGLDEGARIMVRDAVYGLVTESANDAAVVLGEAVGGSEERFAYLMTQQARALGMKNTTYRNANGLHDPEQVTTAFDQAILARAMLYHFPQYYKFFRTRNFSYDGINHRNHNHLMSRYEGMDGIKTGFVRQSGFNLMASAQRNGRRVIGVVFGGRSAVSRDNRMAQILDYGFDRMVAEARNNNTKVAALPAPTPTDAMDAADTNGSGDAAQQGDDTPATKAPSQKVASATPAPTPTPNASLAAEPAPKAGNDKNNWSVQLGTYKNRQQGLNAIQQAKRKVAALDDANGSVIRTKAGRKTIYRARLTGLDEKTARTACDALGNSKSCLTLPPRG